MQIDEKVLLGADIQHLITFLVVHREGSVSRAAACLGVKQPAVSNILAKLRERFDDELFSRKDRWRPTQKAEHLAQMLTPGFACLQQVIVALSGQRGNLDSPLP
ncbi:LysR family transcriptional regulator [Pseudomonas monteilii]|uniref:LysR family transcriptional regulator n=1 Tax=Pseudomonas TaxID=286 RepID=UPI0035257041